MSSINEIKFSRENYGSRIDQMVDQISDLEGSRERRENNLMLKKQR